MNDLAHVVLGATLVAIGVLVTALADRVRGVRLTRDAAPPTHRATSAAALAAPISILAPADLSPKQAVSKPERTRPAGVEARARDGAADDVIAALVAAGYAKPIATDATRACSAGERATIEDWARAALRRCALGEMS